MRNDKTRVVAKNVGVTISFECYSCKKSSTVHVSMDDVDFDYWSYGEGEGGDSEVSSFCVCTSCNASNKVIIR